ncbi:hypothetical protein B566_EDAN011816 [Ephemera danica]|nr:hypothetical protein B566_EDAN011816 [Ephemera danica]
MDTPDILRTMSEEASEQVPEQAEEATESLTLPQGRQRTTSDSVPGSETDIKKLCTEDAVSSRASSMPRDVLGATAAPSTIIPPSPPQVVTLAEVLRAAEGMQNMVLAHEIAVNSEFSLPEPSGPPPDGSLAARVYEMMRKAFWDLLEQELAEDPPCYKQAMVLMQEVREVRMQHTELL